MTTDVETEPSTEADILCPLCEYNLRGLAEPRCPECGHRSTWEELRNRPPLHPYLFEHYPRHNVWSFLRTVFGSIRPWKFWKSVLPAMQLKTKRLVLFGLLCMIFGLAASFMGISGAVAQVSASNARMRQNMLQYHTSLLSPMGRNYDPKAAAGIQRVIQQYGSLEAYEAQRYPPMSSWAFWEEMWQSSGFSPRERMIMLRPATIPLLWMPVTFASLLVFRASMRQARIRQAHVARCVIYTAAPICLYGAYMLVAAFAISDFVRPYGQYSMFGYVDAVYLACAGFVLILALRLMFAYRLYLRFPHALVTVLASQIIVALVLLKIDMMLLGL